MRLPIASTPNVQPVSAVTQEKDYDNASVSVIIPVHDEVCSLPGLVDALTILLKSLDRPWEILVINDASTDGTVEALHDKEIRVISHPYNMGNGAAIKTGIRHALGKIVVMMDGDGQHNPHDIPRLISQIGLYDMVVGARSNGFKQHKTRTLANNIYNWLASYITNFRVRDLTSGFRVIKTHILKRYLYLLPNTFSYPTTLTLALLRSGHSLKYEAIETSTRLGRSKIRLFSDGIRFLVIIFKIATLFSPLKIFLPFSWLFFAMGVANYCYTYYMSYQFTSMSLLMFIAGFLFFLLGLISEQIAQLRLDRTEEKGVSGVQIR